MNTNGMNTIQIAQLLKAHGIIGYLKYVNDHSIIVAVPREDIKSNRIAMEGLKNENQN
ncbi:hypothetical protein [Staphylococcus gallinarum]|nr:hypothetical protein [Staphylococcus gallinarum]